jgi:hypothetical protein
MGKGARTGGGMGYAWAQRAHQGGRGALWRGDKGVPRMATVAGGGAPARALRGRGNDEVKLQIGQGG